MLGSLWPDTAATAAFLLAVRLGTYPETLLRKVGPMFSHLELYRFTAVTSEVTLLAAADLLHTNST